MISLPFSKRTLGRLAGLASFALLAGSLAADSAHAEEWTKSYNVSGRARVHVDSNDGSVRVTTGDSTQVEFRVIYNGYTVDKNLNITSRQDGNQVEVSARVRNNMNWGWGGIHKALRIEVHMPRNADLNIDTGDGSVESDAVNGSLDIRTGEGNRGTSQNHGKMNGGGQPLTIHTGDGSIHLSKT